MIGENRVDESIVGNSPGSAGNASPTAVLTNFAIDGLDALDLDIFSSAARFSGVSLAPNSASCFLLTPHRVAE